MHTITKPVERLGITEEHLPEQACANEQCDETFKLKDPRQKYCNPKCGKQQRYRNKRNAQDQEEGGPEANLFGSPDK